MIKQNKTTLILGSLVLLIPVMIGLLLWDQLPEQIPSHWGINGEVDGWSSKSMAVFGFPGLLLAIHWLCVLFSSADPKHKQYSPTMLKLVLWLCPVLSLVVNSLVYATALGYSIDISLILPLFEGILFIIIGNLLPKCRQSYTMGIKLPWTLANEENWNKTHRLGGKVWVIGGVVILATAFFRQFWIMIGILALMVLIPAFYSYLLYRKQQTENEN